MGKQNSKADDVAKKEFRREQRRFNKILERSNWKNLSFDATLWDGDEITSSGGDNFTKERKQTIDFERTSNGNIKATRILTWTDGLVYKFVFYGSADPFARSFVLLNDDDQYAFGSINRKENQLTLQIMGPSVFEEKFVATSHFVNVA
jgi:hypothetical protein